MIILIIIYINNQKQTRSKPEANQKQTKSKPEANQKRTRSEPEANQKQTRSKPKANQKQTRSKPEANQPLMPQTNNMSSFTKQIITAANMINSVKRNNSSIQYFASQK